MKGLPRSMRKGHLPARFTDLGPVCEEAWGRMKSVDGYLSAREARCLLTAASLAPAKGANVEIGSFKGRSTVGLASVLRHYGLGRLVAVDPHTAPSSTDPDLKGKRSSYDDFQHNIARNGVADYVDARVTYSHELARNWSEPIRFLWIDGDHTYEAAKRDIEDFKPQLVAGALVLMHDVLGTHYGSLRAFVEEILESNEFSATGFCGSIGWSQYCPSDGRRLAKRIRKKLLTIPARQIMPVAKSPRGLVGWNKLRYKIWRPLAPHGEMTPVKLWSLIQAC